MHLHTIVEHLHTTDIINLRVYKRIMLQVVQEVIDRSARIEFRPNTEDDPHKRKPDITKAKQLLGWEPRVTLRKGLPLMVADFRNRIFGDQKEAAAGGGGATSSSMYSAN